MTKFTYQISRANLPRRDLSAGRPGWYWQGQILDFQMVGPFQTRELADQDARNTILLETGKDPVKIAKAERDAEYYRQYKAEKDGPAPAETEQRDPVYSHGGMWFFWNETWTDVLGAYRTEKAARKALSDYQKSLEPKALLPEQDYRLLGATTYEDLYNGLTVSRARKASNIRNIV